MTISDESRIVPHFTFKEQANNESDEEPKFRLETMEAVEHQFMIEELRMWAVETYPKQFGQSGLRVSSGFRNPLYNKKIGGASNSCHLDTRATDFDNIPEILFNDFEVAWRVICSIHKRIGGIELYHWGIHVDSFSDKFGNVVFRRKDNR